MVKVSNSLHVKHSQDGGGRWQRRNEVTKLTGFLCGGIGSHVGKLLGKQTGYRHQGFPLITHGHWSRTINESVQVTLAFGRPTDQTFRAPPQDLSSTQHNHFHPDIKLNQSHIPNLVLIMKTFADQDCAQLAVLIRFRSPSVCFKAILNPYISGILKWQTSHSFKTLRITPDIS